MCCSYLLDNDGRIADRDSFLDDINPIESHNLNHFINTSREICDSSSLRKLHEGQVDGLARRVMSWRRSNPGNGPVVVTAGELVAEVEVGQVAKRRDRRGESSVEARVVVTAVHIQRSVLELVDGGAALDAGEDLRRQDVGAPARLVQLHRRRDRDGPVGAAGRQQVRDPAGLRGDAGFRVVGSVIVVELRHGRWEGSAGCVA